MNFTILRYETIGSTNDEAISQAKMGASEGLCIVANYQTSGRGRHGRKWISPPAAGLNFSIVLRPEFEMRFIPLITLMSGVAVHDTLQETACLECDIKWVNDVYVNEKKVCGILAESCETNRGLAVVVGIGINLLATNFPDELKENATSIETETGIPPALEVLLRTLTKNLDRCYSILQGENGFEKIRNLWTERSSYAFGKTVSVESAGESFSGVTRGIEENGALRVETSDGVIKIVEAGEVKKLRQEV